MALMLPSLVPRDAPPGEKEVFRRLKDDPASEQWRILHSLDIARHQTQISGEADFVIIVPNAGIVVLEVKSHTRIHYGPAGWYFGSGSTPEKRGPFRQAADAMHSLRNYVIEQRPDMARIPFCSAVAFPSVKFQVQSPEWHPWQLIDRQLFHAKPFSTLIGKILEEALSHFRGKGLQLEGPDDRQCSEVSDLLRPVFDLMASPRALREQLETDVLQCTQEQFEALDTVEENRRVLFEGPAGSGKTSLGLEIWRRWNLEQPNSAGALFCFNRLLSTRLRMLTRVDPVSKRVGSFSAFLLECAQLQPNQQEAGDASFWSDRLPAIAADALMAKENSQMLDFVIIDEAQDLLRPPFLDVMDLILKGGLASGQWMMFGDFAKQNLYAPDALSPEQFVELRSPRTARFHLSINCRNTPRVASFVELLGNMHPGYRRVLRGDDQVAPFFSYHHTDGEQDAAVQDFLELALREGFQRKDIVLLSPFKHNSATRLAKTNKWKSILAAYREEDIEHIRYTTIQSFKGLESLVILLTDLNQLSDEHDADLFYTGISRALARIGIFASVNIQAAILKNIERRSSVSNN